MSDLDGAPPPGPSPEPPRGSAPGFPPPGAPPQGALPPPGATPWQRPVGPALWGAAHKPGAIPLKPLGLGEIYDGAFRIIRYNPRATVGAAALVAAVTMLVPIIITAVLTWTIGATYDQLSTDPVGSDPAGALGAFGSLGLGSVLQSLGLLLVTGMVARVTAAAAVGRRLTLTEAWAETRGRRWRLVGLSFLLFLATAAFLGVLAVVVIVLFVVLPVVAAILLTLVLGAAGVAAMCWFWVRVYLLPVPALMIEQVGVVDSIGRGFRLSRGGFWRIFGIALLTVVITGFASSLLSTPISILTSLGSLAAGPEYAALVLVVGNAVGTVIGSAFVAPFSSAVTTLQYLDQRIRHEAYDVELMEQAGLTLS